MSKHLVSAALAIAALSTAGCASSYNDYSAYDSGRREPYASQYRTGCYPGERRDDCRERLRYERQTQQRYVWRDGQYYEQRDDNSAAIAAGIIGFILGAAIVGSTKDRDQYEANKKDRDWLARCRAQHPSFDAHTGTYVGPDGRRRYCTR